MSKDANWERAVDKHRERLMTNPDPITGKPLSHREAEKRTADLANKLEKEQKK